MIVTSGSSARTATVQYVQSFYGGPPLFWSTGRIMVMKATHRYAAFRPDGSYQVIDGTAERPGPPKAARGYCEYSGHKGTGNMELVYLTPAKPPLAQTMAACCTAWPEPNATLYRPAGMCDD